jgi:ribonuclease R
MSSALPPRAAVSRPTDVAGRIRVVPAGYAFVERDDGEEDVFIPAAARGAALDGDRVQISTWAGPRGTEGRVRTILERGRARLTGTVRGTGRNLYLEPDDPRIGGAVGLDGGLGGARVGQAVIVEIVEYPGAPGGPMRARVARVLGSPEDPRTEVMKVLEMASIPEEFPADAQREASRVAPVVGVEERAGRVDLRDLPLLVIDPEDARDHDDAVAVLPQEGGFRLWVAIADVSHYVRAGGALDREARGRGCSVYLPDRAVPMLPPELSSDLCSLLPGRDRLALVARIDFDAEGKPRGTELCAAVVRCKAGLSYGGVAADRYPAFGTEIRRMLKLAEKLRERREKRGALNFEIPEAKVVLDEDDPLRVRDVIRSRATPQLKTAYGLVEEFMLAANEAVARHFRERKKDAVFRVHDAPDADRFAAFAQVAEALGHPLPVDAAESPKRIRQFLERLAGRPGEQAVSMLLLRAMKQATYDAAALGHFALASRDYLHFTSPIRRYPDLVVHRLLKHDLGVDADRAPGRAELVAIAADSSRHERRAMEAEREIVDLYRAYLMRDRIGDEFEGTITGVAGFGAFVQIDSPFVEGLVRIERLGDDFYDFDEVAMRLVARSSGHALTLGDRLRVRVEDVSVARRQIELVAALPSREGRNRGARGASRPRPARDRKRRRNGR